MNRNKNSTDYPLFTSLTFTPRDSHCSRTRKLFVKVPTGSVLLMKNNAGLCTEFE